MEHLIDQRRIRQYKGESRPQGPVLYWVHREFRFHDNWALYHARAEAMRRQVPVAVVFCLVPEFLGATLRQFDFLLKGMEASGPTLQQANIPLILRSGDPATEINRLCKELQPALVVTDFDPLRIKRHWLQTLLKGQTAPVHEVDSRNIVPVWAASPKREYMARTIRPKIHKLLPEFLTPFPEFPSHPYAWDQLPASLSFAELHQTLKVDTRVAPVDWLQAGEEGAQQTLTTFLSSRLNNYAQRNDPNKEACSDLSAYLHFGMISAQRILLEIDTRGLSGENVEAFVEELVVRRELSDNFCFYSADYDQVSAFPEWAQRTLEEHRTDPRPYLYSLEEFDQAATHRPLWNAAQRQLVQTGAMHGYMRMYWAKKILEWTPNPAEAMRIAIHLNDRYALDGRESNGYTGIAWSIGGVHDRGWTKRPVFGSIRYMNANGARRKFDAQQYIRTWAPQQQGSLFE